MLAQLSQQAKAVDARFVAVAPTKIERIASDDRNVAYQKLVRDGFGGEHALARPLVDTLRAGTGAAQRGRVVPANETVRPGDAQARVALLHYLARLDRRPAPLRRFTHHQLTIEGASLNRDLSGVLAKGFFDRASLDVPVRSVPHGFTVAQDDGLRRFVLDARARLYLAREVARALDDDHRYVIRDARHLRVGGGADRTRRAMLKDDDGFFMRARQQVFQVFHISDRCELFHHRGHPRLQIFYYTEHLNIVPSPASLPQRARPALTFTRTKNAPPYLCRQRSMGKDEGGRMKDEVKAIKTVKHSFHHSSFILHPCFSVSAVWFATVG